MKVLEISKKELKNNLDIIKKLIEKDTPNVKKVYMVVKGNGVGLGLVQITKFLSEQGFHSFAIANLEEALELRKNGIKDEILMLTPTSIKEEIKSLIENDVTLTIGTMDELKLAQEVLSELKKDSHTAHIKIDTGFGRYGFVYTEKEKILDAIKNSGNIKIEGMYMHFPNPLVEKNAREQFSKFMDIVKYLEENNAKPEILHAASSGAFLRYPEMRLNAVRIGSLVQGRTRLKELGFIPVGKFKATVSEVKIVPKGHTISYGCTYTTKRETKIAIVPVGYQDGYWVDKKRDDFRFKNNIIAILMEVKKLFKDNSQTVKIHGKTYKKIGRMGMYHFAVDITGTDDIKPGDEVEVDIVPLHVNESIRREYI